nr:MAG: hypothetical protein DIU78_02775 [Pseudomonadota bacterium]
MGSEKHAPRRLAEPVASRPGATCLRLALPDEPDDRVGVPPIDPIATRLGRTLGGDVAQAWPSTSS